MDSFGDAVYIYGGNVSVLGTYIDSCGGAGIWVEYASGAYIVGNTLVNCSLGVVVYGFGGAVVRDNVFIDCGLFVYDSHGNVVGNNTVNGLPLLYLEGVQDFVVDGGYGQVVVVDSVNVSVVGLCYANTSVGVEFWNASGVIEWCVFDGNYYGVYVGASNNVLIIHNNFTNNYYGLGLVSSSGVLCYLNNFIGNEDDLYGGSGCRFYSSEILSYYYGGLIHRSYLGNYWGSYSDVDSDGDGVWDSGYGSDNYPLVMPFEYYRVIGVALIESLEPEDFVFEIALGSSLTFSVDLYDSCDVYWYVNGSLVVSDLDVLYSWCDVTFSRIGTYNVTVVVTRGDNIDKSVWVIYVYEPLSIIEYYPNVTEYWLLVGSTLNLSIVLNDVANVSWYVDGVLVRVDNNVTCSSYLFRGSREGTFTIYVEAEGPHGYTYVSWTIHVSGEIPTTTTGTETSTGTGVSTKTATPIAGAKEMGGVIVAFAILIAVIIVAIVFVMARRRAKELGSM